MVCHDCGVEAATKQVTFHQNIGALVVRFPKTVQGQLCKSCIHKHFWSMTGTTLVLGWWGTISLIVTPIFLVNNIGRYLTCLTMPKVPEGAAPEPFTEKTAEKLAPYRLELFKRLNAGEKFPTIAASIATRAGVTPRQVAAYAQAIMNAAQQQKNS